MPNSGDFLTIISEDHSKVLVREEKNIYLLSNICKHRQAVMLKEEDLFTILYVLFIDGHTNCQMIDCGPKF